MASPRRPDASAIKIHHRFLIRAEHSVCDLCSVCSFQNTYTMNRATPLSVLRYVFLIRSESPVADPYNAFNEALLTTLHPFFALILAVIPFLKTILDNLVSLPQVLGDSTLISGRKQWKISALGSWVRIGTPRSDVRALTLLDSTQCCAVGEPRAPSIPS